MLRSKRKMLEFNCERNMQKNLLNTSRSLEKQKNKKNAKPTSLLWGDVPADVQQHTKCNGWPLAKHWHGNSPAPWLTKQGLQINFFSNLLLISLIRKIGLQKSRLKCHGNGLQRLEFVTNRAWDLSTWHTLYWWLEDELETIFCKFSFKKLHRLGFLG